MSSFPKLNLKGKANRHAKQAHGRALRAAEGAIVKSIKWRGNHALLVNHDLPWFPSIKAHDAISDSTANKLHTRMKAMSEELEINITTGSSAAEVFSDANKAIQDDWATKTDLEITKGYLNGDIPKAHGNEELFNRALNYVLTTQQCSRGVKNYVEKLIDKASTHGLNRIASYIYVHPYDKTKLVHFVDYSSAKHFQHRYAKHTNCSFLPKVYNEYLGYDVDGDVMQISIVERVVDNNNKPEHAGDVHRALQLTVHDFVRENDHKVTLYSFIRYMYTLNYMRGLPKGVLRPWMSVIHELVELAQFLNISPTRRVPMELETSGMFYREDGSFVTYTVISDNFGGAFSKPDNSKLNRLRWKKELRSGDWSKSTGMIIKKTHDLGYNGSAVSVPVLTYGEQSCNYNGYEERPSAKEFKPWCLCVQRTREKAQRHADTGVPLYE